MIISFILNDEAQAQVFFKGIKGDEVAWKSTQKNQKNQNQSMIRLEKMG